MVVTGTGDHRGPELSEVVAEQSRSGRCLYRGKWRITESLPQVWEEKRRLVRNWTPTQAKSGEEAYFSFNFAIPIEHTYSTGFRRFAPCYSPNAETIFAVSRRLPRRVSTAQPVASSEPHRRVTRSSSSATSIRQVELPTEVSSHPLMTDSNIYTLTTSWSIRATVSFFLNQRFQPIIWLSS